MKRMRQKKAEKVDKSQKTLSKRQEAFCSLIATGAEPQHAFLTAGYSPRAVSSNPYKLLKRHEIQEHIQGLINRALPQIVKNDIALAKLRVHKGEGADISPSLIEGAKTRLYDRSSLGPVIKKVEAKTMAVSMSIPDEERIRLMKAVGMMPDDEAVRDE